MEFALRVQVEELPEGLFLATSSELEGPVAQGRTVAEALDIARDVARKILETRRDRDGSTPCQRALSLNTNIVSWLLSK